MQKGNKNTRVRRDIDGNAGAVGMHWDRGYFPQIGVLAYSRQVTSFLQSPKLCLPPQIPSDLLTPPSSWLVTQLQTLPLTSSLHLLLSRMKPHCFHVSLIRFKNLIGYSVPCPGTSYMGKLFCRLVCTVRAGLSHASP